MGLHQNLMDIVNVLYYDETLLRLLYYPTADLSKDIHDPLDDSLPNVLDMDEESQWDIRNKRICFSSKNNDIPPDQPFSRIYVYAGRRRADGNYLMADQELVIDIFVHNDWENGDLRSTRISDRLNELLVLNKITGIGKMNYNNGSPITSPAEYVGYRHIFEFTEFKK